MKNDDGYQADGEDIECHGKEKQSTRKKRIKLKPGNIFRKKCKDIIEEDLDEENEEEINIEEADDEYEECVVTDEISEGQTSVDKWEHISDFSISSDPSDSDSDWMM